MESKVIVRNEKKPEKLKVFKCLMLILNVSLHLPPSPMPQKVIRSCKLTVKKYTNNIHKYVFVLDASVVLNYNSSVK